jgi:hypothetical protein
MRRFAGVAMGIVVLAWAAQPAAATPEATVAIDAATVGGTVPPLGTNFIQNGDNLADPVTGATYTGVTSFLAANQGTQIARWSGLGANCLDPSNTNRALQQQTVDHVTNHACTWTENNAFQHGDFARTLGQINPAADALVVANPCWMQSLPGGGSPSGKPACSPFLTGPGTQACQIPPTLCPGATITANWARQMKDAGHSPRYWELGNEVFANGYLPPDQYKAISNAYVTAIKGVDPAALVGGDANDFGANPAPWDQAVASSNVDFLATHLYWPNMTDLFAKLDTARLLVGYRRIQNWSFENPTAGTREIAVDALVTKGDADLTIVVDPRADGTSAATVTKPLTVAAGPVRTVLRVPGLSAGRHQLSIQAAPAATSLSTERAVVSLGHGWLCDTSCPLAEGNCPAGCTPIDLGLTPEDNPYAIAVLHAKHGATTRSLTTGAPASLQVAAYSMPASATAACPTLKLQLDGGAWQTLTLKKPTGTVATGDACHSFLNPSIQTLPGQLTAGTHSVRIATAVGETGEVYVTSLTAVSGGQTLGRADLSPNEGGHDTFHRLTYAGLGSEARPGPVLGRLKALEALAAPTNKRIMVSEFGGQFLSSFQGSTSQGESLMAALYTASAVQTFTRRSPALLAMISWALDNVGFRTMQCSTTSAFDTVAQRPCATGTPRNSLVGWVFTMLKGHLHGQWVRTDVTAPTFAVDESLYDADGNPIGPNPRSTTSTVQALATKGTGVVDVQFVNLATHPVTTEVTLAGVSPSGSATLRSLAGDPRATDGCLLDAFKASFGCTPAAIVPGAPQALTAAPAMTVTLPASSFSILSVPTT